MQSGPSFRLVVRRGPQPNQQFILTRETVTLGRDITNDIVINDPEISRHHSRMIRTPSGYTLEDLRSTNGTFVNRQRLTTPYQLANGDTIGLGETVTLTYEVANEGAAATMVAGGGAGGQAQPQPAPYAPPQPAQPVQPAGGGFAPAPAPAPAAQLPLAEEEEFQPDRNRWIVIGCSVLTLLFCCALVAGAMAIDYFNLYCQLPLASQLFPGCP